MGVLQWSDTEFTSHIPGNEHKLYFIACLFTEKEHNVDQKGKAGSMRSFKRNINMIKIRDILRDCIKTLF